MSHGSDTIELISSNRPSPYPLSDTETLCILIDNGKVVNSSGQVMNKIDSMDPNSSKQQMESLWSLLISLPLIAADLENIQDNIDDTLGKVSSLYKKLNANSSI